MASYSPAEIAKFTDLYSRNIIPLRVVLAALTWVLHDYFETLEDEVRYIWSQQRGIGKTAYLFVRYYTLALLVFDVAQIHSFAIPGVTSNSVCLAMDPTIRVVGAISLWTIEIIMQIRIYALYSSSRKIALFNGVLFLISIGLFIWILATNAIGRADRIASAIRLPLPGCPAINGGIAWAQWLPATGFEAVLFGFALYKSFRTMFHQRKIHDKWTVSAVLLGDNILYFFGITALLIFNNVMASGSISKYIPWYSYGPFHAAMGIMTTRMLMHLRKVAVRAHRGGDTTINGDSMLTDNSHFYRPKFATRNTASVGYSSGPTAKYSQGSTPSKDGWKSNSDAELALHDKRMDGLESYSMSTIHRPQ
ncbi:hypothetical protein D9611_001402 [Ephemerocybe angulata]|uniref:DUF6533 domain-containing protein n=1 Tax=Ephemerocybe angulata TaxID=980116 RepID=A0A8H5CJR3_9AGAR|nr:hypothetical protein D9611_001402 [Tulosesus angulatus]